MVMKEGKRDAIWVGATTGGLILAFAIMMVVWQIFKT